MSHHQVFTDYMSHHQDTYCISSSSLIHCLLLTTIMNTSRMCQISPKSFEWNTIYDLSDLFSLISSLRLSLAKLNFPLLLLLFFHLVISSLHLQLLFSLKIHQVYPYHAFLTDLRQLICRWDYYLNPLSLP